MANNYTSFSCLLPLTPEQVEYAKDLLSEESDELFQILDDDYVGFDHDPEKRGYWFHSDEGNPEQLANFIHHLVAKFDLPPFGFEWANTCSKPRIDEFGGGAVWITKEDFEWLSTSCWLNRKRNPQ